MASWLNGGWFITYSGEHLDPLRPDPAKINLTDIAHHLSMICRFGGACPTFYSVASHSMYVADLLPEDLRVEGLLHDAAEAYVGDMIKAIKVYCPDFQYFEAEWERAIRVRFELPIVQELDVKRAIKRADIAALLAERRDVFRDRTAYEEISEPGEARCVPVGPEEGKALFLAYAKRVGLR
jgi:hypothetical protein